MATKQEQQELIEILKFTPRTYKITMWGYGGEKVMGTVDPKVWDYCLQNRVDLVDLAWGYEYAEENELDEEQLPFTPGSWYECDSMGHVNGVSRDAGTLQIEDENGNTVFEKSFDDCDGCEGSPEWSCDDEVWIGSRAKGEVVFIGSSNEKGTFFEGEINLRAPFDIEKLELHYTEIDGEEIINAAYYDGEEIENWGGSTDGKSSDMNLVRIIDDEGNWERYELPEIDEEESPLPDVLVFDPLYELNRQLHEFKKEFGECDHNFEEQSENNKTEWFDISVKPHYKGEYECEFESATWPFPIERMCEWTGRSWKENGEKVVGIKRWRGLAVNPNET